VKVSKEEQRNNDLVTVTFADQSDPLPENETKNVLPVQK
jgi:hypothetical protein